MKSTSTTVIDTAQLFLHRHAAACEHALKSKGYKFATVDEDRRTIFEIVYPTGDGPEASYSATLIGHLDQLERFMGREFGPDWDRPCK